MKFLTLFLAGLLTLSLAGCGGTEAVTGGTEAVTGGYILQQNDAARGCQEEAAVKLSNRLSEIEVTKFGMNAKYVNNYNFYDKDKNQIVSYSWDGKNKDIKADVSFVCYISSSTSKDSDYKIHSIIMYNGSQKSSIAGSENFSAYDSSGKSVNWGD